jgi:hypothetical protein
MNDEGASDGKVDGGTVGRSTGAVLGFGCGNTDKLLVSKAKSCREILLGRYKILYNQILPNKNLHQHSGMGLLEKFQILLFRYH